jgi:hypothetical protein
LFSFGTPFSLVELRHFVDERQLQGHRETREGGGAGGLLAEYRVERGQKDGDVDDVELVRPANVGPFEPQSLAADAPRHPALVGLRTGSRKENGIDDGGDEGGREEPPIPGVDGVDE